MADRQICTPENPMLKGSTGRWEHTGAEEVGVCMDGCCANYRCIDCGHQWGEELPQ